MKKRCLAGLMTHQYKKLPVTMKMWMQFNVMPRTQVLTIAARDQYQRLYSTMLNDRSSQC